MARSRLGNDREDTGLAPVRVDRGPVVRGDERARVPGGLEPVPVLSDLGPDPALDGPGDLPVRHQRGDGDGHVVAAERVVVQRLPVHVDHEGVVAAVTGSPVASISMPVLSMATCPCGSQSTRRPHRGRPRSFALPRVARSSSSRNSSSLGARAAAQPVLPAGGMPVPALVQGHAAGHPGTVGRPGHDVRGARRDLLVAAGAAVGLGGRRSGHPADHPVAVWPRLDALGPGHGVRRAGAVAADPARAHACPA